MPESWRHLKASFQVKYAEFDFSFLPVMFWKEPETTNSIKNEVMNSLIKRSSTVYF